MRILLPVPSFFVTLVEKLPLSAFRFVIRVEKLPLSVFKSVTRVEKLPLSVFRFVSLVDIEALGAVPSNTFSNPLPSPIKCPNEAVEVDEPLIAKLPSLGTSNRVLAPAWSLLYSSSRINLLAAESNLKLIPL